MSYSRRDLLKFGAGTAALLASGIPGLGLFADEEKKEEKKETAKKKIPIAVQLYSIRDVAGSKVPDTVEASLEALAKMGYAGVEFAGFYGMKAEDLRKLLDKYNLKAAGSHTGLEQLLGDAFANTVAFNKVLGNEYLIVPGLDGQFTSSEAAVKKAAKIFNEVAAKLKEHGMKTGYHCHPGDFKKIGDSTLWEILFDNTDNDVCAQLDIGHCTTGKHDAAAMIKKYPGRARTVHVKESGGPEGALIGEGNVKWNDVFDACESVGGTQWYVIEQEAYKKGSTPMDAVKLDIENVHNKFGR
jgi:sugar phosphate isomerase/epimerase